MKPKRIIYFNNEQYDEVVDFKNKDIKIDKDYKYIHSNLFYNFFSWLTYRIFATPIFWFYFKFITPVRYVNKRVLKDAKHTGYFIYGNHTNQFVDGVCPTFICFPQKPHFICTSANISIPFWGKLTKMWGALPIPNTIEATKNFHNAIEFVLKQHNPIIIYPEAHLWPYYTKIREFPTTSFRYPIKYNKPVFTFTTTYQKRMFFKKPKITIYVDGPFYHDKNLPEKQAQQELRDAIFNIMNKRATNNTYEYIKYQKKEQQ